MGDERSVVGRVGVPYSKASIFRRQKSSPARKSIESTKLASETNHIPTKLLPSFALGDDFRGNVES